VRPRRARPRRVGATPSQAPLKLRAGVSAFLVAGVLLRAPQASACGVSASGAPGLCDASAVLDENRASGRDRVGASYGFTSSVLYFSDGFRAPTQRHVVMGTWEHPLPGRWTFGVDVGALVGGHLADSLFQPGVVAAVSLSHVLITPRGYASPFLLSSFTLAGMYARTTNPASSGGATDYTAFDISFALTAGVPLRTAAGVVTPFIAGRIFGGPVFWSHDGGVLGTDAYKYALGPGLAFALLHARLLLNVDGSVFGERALRLGASVSF
jgi:hypothetical protein